MFMKLKDYMLMAIIYLLSLSFVTYILMMGMKKATRIKGPIDYQKPSFTYPVRTSTVYNGIFMVEF